MLLTSTAALKGVETVMAMRVKGVWKIVSVVENSLTLHRYICEFILRRCRHCSLFGVNDARSFSCRGIVKNRISGVSYRTAQENPEQSMQARLNLDL